MQERHKNRDLYFDEQTYTTRKYVIPFIEDHLALGKGTKVLEIGCGEGGNIRPFLEKGCEVTGIDISANKIANAKKFFENDEHSDRLILIENDIYNVKDDIKYDLIVMRDVLEHIHNQERFLKYVKKFLKDDALFFLGFPPWQNPFGGHQQISSNKYLSKLPYFHVLPRGIYKSVLNLFEKNDRKIESLLEIKDTSITIERFNRIIKKENYQVVKKIYYFINPNYEIKFKLKPKKQNSIISSIPYFRNYLITTCYFLIKESKEF